MSEQKSPRQLTGIFLLSFALERATSYNVGQIFPTLDNIHQNS
jgi:hypothetical protein